MLTPTKKIYTIEEIKEKVTPIFEKRGVIQAVIFGSYATGKAHEESDIDFVVKVDENMCLFEFAGISGDVEEALEKRIDFLPMHHVPKGGEIDMVVRERGLIIFDEIR